MFIPPLYITKTIAVGGSETFNAPGRFARILEATLALSIGFDNGAPIPNLQVGQMFRCESGDSFQRITVENPATAAAPVTFTIVYGFTEIVDDRVHIDSSTVITINPSNPNFATSTAFTTTTQTAAAAAGVLLIAADATRRELWLWTDEATNQAWFAESLAQLAAPLAFQQIGMTLEGFTKLRTTAAVYVKAANGVKIGAISFKA